MSFEISDERKARIKKLAELRKEAEKTQPTEAELAEAKRVFDLYYNKTGNAHLKEEAQKARALLQAWFNENVSPQYD